MNGLLQQIRLSLRLYFRNTMALIYGYIFPTIFLVAFRVLYRFDRVQLVRHVGELLTVTVLGGACFGLPTTLVGERERGVWRRYRLTPIPTSTLVVGAVAARYVILLTAGVLQILLAMGAGMPHPPHPLALTVAFTFVSFAFLGLGLVIAMMADNVPAVQALGQCIFLPMLIIGGVAVPLASLPDWAQHLAAFFPGRYAVETIQATVTGQGLDAARFGIFALTVIGLAGMVVGAKMFRWDSAERFVTRSGKAWVGLALVSWAAVGVLAEVRGHVGVPSFFSAESSAPAPVITAAPAAPAAPIATASVPADIPSATPASPAAATPPTRRAPSASPGTIAPAATLAPSAPAPAPARSPSPGAPPPVPARSTTAASVTKNTSTTTPPSAPVAAPSAPASATSAPGTSTTPPGPSSWQAVTVKDIDDAIDFQHLPPDSGVVTPIATSNDQPGADLADQLAYITDALVQWPPAKVADPVQRVRNILYVAAAPDVLQVPLEQYVPAVVFARLQADIPKDTLVKLLYWIAVHPDDGDNSAVAQLRSLGFGEIPSDLQEVRDRTGVYAVKLLGRLLGRIKPQ